MKLGNSEGEQSKRNETQFLTFRNGPNLIETTDRSIYSQKFEGHFDTSLRKLNTMRSHQKTVGLKQEAMMSIEENHEDELTHDSRNELLEKKLSRLLKGLKKEERRHTALTNESTLLLKEMESGKEQLAQQVEYVESLREICDQNIGDYNKMLRRYEELEEGNVEMATKVERLEEFIDHNELKIETSRQEDQNVNSYYINVKEGFTELEQFHQEVTARALHMHSEIQVMKAALEQLRDNELELKTGSKVH